MATIEISRPHTMGLTQAKAAVEAVALQLQADLNARYVWQGNRLAFTCPGAEGCIAVDDATVKVTVDLGWLLRPMRGRIEQSVRQYLDDKLA